jgi:hypothetical protein
MNMLTYITHIKVTISNDAGKDLSCTDTDTVSYPIRVQVRKPK